MANQQSPQVYTARQKRLKVMPEISVPLPVHLPTRKSKRKQMEDRSWWRSPQKLDGSSPISNLPRPPPKVKQQSPIRKNFATAFSKAIAVRMRKLSRVLTVIEWRQLRDAVRKQCSIRKTDSMSRQLEALTARMTRYENANPQGALQLQDSIHMLHTQVSVLREQALSKISEHDNVSESCPHFMGKRRFFPPRPELLASDIVLPSLGHVVWYPKNNEIHTCCDRCLQNRTDSLFYWTGCHLTSFNSFNFHNESELAGMSKSERREVLPDSLHPLMIQDIWSQIISQKFKAEI